MTNEKCHSEQHQTSQTNEEPLKTQTQVNPQALLSPHRFTSYTAPSPNSFSALFYKVKQSPFFGLCLSNRSGFGELEFPHKRAPLQFCLLWTGFKRNWVHDNAVMQRQLPDEFWPSLLERELWTQGA